MSYGKIHYVFSVNKINSRYSFVKMCKISRRQKVVLIAALTVSRCGHAIEIHCRNQPNKSKLVVYKLLL